MAEMKLTQQLIARAKQAISAVITERNKAMLAFDTTIASLVAEERALTKKLDELRWEEQKKAYVAERQKLFDEGWPKTKCTKCGDDFPCEILSNVCIKCDPASLEGFTFGSG